MIFTSALLILLSAPITSDAYVNYQELTNQLNGSVEWIDENGSSQLSKSDAKRLLQKFAKGLSKESYSVRHSSEWKNDKCFKIIQLKGHDRGYRVFFQCAINHKSEPVVTKVKVNKI